MTSPRSGEGVTSLAQGVCAGAKNFNWLFPSFLSQVSVLTL